MCKNTPNKRYNSPVVVGVQRPLLGPLDVLFIDATISAPDILVFSTKIAIREESKYRWKKSIGKEVQG
jgi:hypothetical protein